MVLTYSTERQFFHHLKALERAGYGGERILMKVGKGIVRKYDKQIKAALKKKSPHLKTTDYVESLRGFKKRFLLHFHKAEKTVKAVIKTTNKLFKGLSEAEFNERTEAILRIPADELQAFNYLSSTERAERLKELILEHEQGGNGCGYSESMLNAPGVYNPYYANESQDVVQKRKRVPSFLYELIDRFIYEAIKPNFHKKIFFKTAYELDDEGRKIQKTSIDPETGELVGAYNNQGQPIYKLKRIKKWNSAKRLIRAEGRMAMVKVMIVLIKWTTYKTCMRIGKAYRDKDTGKMMYVGISRQTIADESNLSINSVKVALRNLEETKCLYPSVHQYDEYKEGDEKKFAGVALVRKMKNFVIEQLGLSAAKKQEQDKDKNPDSVFYQPEVIEPEELEKGRQAGESYMSEMKASLSD